MNDVHYENVRAALIYPRAIHRSEVGHFNLLDLVELAHAFDSSHMRELEQTIEIELTHSSDALGTSIAPWSVPHRSDLDKTLFRAEAD